MWTIIKFDRKNYNLLKIDLKDKIGESVKIYRPKVLLKSFKKKKFFSREVDILGDYFFCYHEKFSEKSFLNKLKYLRGLKYYLNGFNMTQLEISEFISKCKSLEDESGFISENLFDLNKNKEYIFLTGPFISKLFKIINIKKNNIQILMGNLKTTIKSKEFLFNPA